MSHELKKDASIGNKLSQSNCNEIFNLNLNPNPKANVDESDETLKFYLSGLFNIETSPAFKQLELLKNKKEISNEKQLLYNGLLATAEYEKSLAKKAKQLSQDLSMQRMEKDKTISKQFSQNAEIGDLKRELVKVLNEVQLASERESKIKKDLDESLKQKQELLKEIEDIRKHKVDILEPTLIASTKELKVDLIQKKHQVENLEKDLEEKTSMLETAEVEIDRLEVEKEKVSIALSKAMDMPGRISKQSDILRDAINSLHSENQKQSNLGQQLDKELERLGKKKKDLEDLKHVEIVNYDQRRGEISLMEKQADDIYKDHEIAKEQLAFQKSERVRLEIALKRIQFEMKREHDAVIKAIKEKDNQLKLHRRLVTSLNNIKMSTPLIQKQYEERKREWDQLKLDEKFYKKSLVELRKDIDVALFDYLKTEKVEKQEAEKVGEMMEDNKELEQELEKVHSRSNQLSNQVDGLKIEKDLKAKEVIRIQSKFRALSDEKSIKDSALQDASKRSLEAQTRFKDSATLYEFVKNERNKYLNQIQSTTQKAAEMKEKIRILSNEIEILRLEISKKDKELKRKHQETLNAYAARDAARNEANKSMTQYKTKRDIIDQNLTNLESLNLEINAIEQDMQRLKSCYESGMKERNATGVHLLDRNDELCILYEKLNIQQEIMKRGEDEVRNKQEQISKLQLLASELNHKIDLEKQKLPVNSELLNKSKQLEAELLNVRKIVNELSVKMESPNEPQRCRHLKGRDLTRKELFEKIDKLEFLLAEKEEKLLEKDLILDEVCTLTDRLKKQTLDGRQESNETTTKLNDLAKRIKSVTRSMMAKVSELSMHQALAMNLFQEKSEKESQIQTLKTCLEQGQVQLDFIEKDLVKLERAKQVQQTHEPEQGTIGQLIQIEDDGFYYVNGIRTMAEPRPNAYVPEITSDLPIPKPFGANAPFKSKEIGSQLRHFKKPIDKPIKI